MLDSNAKQGDLAIRTDIGRTFSLATTTPTLLSSWYELLARRNTVTTVANQSAMLALTNVQVGDMVIRSDVQRVFMLSTNTPGVLANWIEVPQRVQSVAGLTGDVVLTTANVAEATTRLYYTDDRARAAIVRQTISTVNRTTSPSEAAVFTALNTKMSRLGDVMNGNFLIQNGDLSLTTNGTIGGNLTVAASTTLKGTTTITSPLFVAPTVPNVNALTLRDSFNRDQLVFSTATQTMTLRDVADVTATMQVSPVEMRITNSLSIVEARAGYIRIYESNGAAKMPVLNADVVVKQYVDTSIEGLPVRQYAGTTTPAQPSIILAGVYVGPTATSNVAVNISARSSTGMSATFTMNGAYNTVTNTVQQLGRVITTMRYAPGGVANATMTPSSTANGMVDITVSSSNTDTWTWKATVTYSKTN